MTSPAIRAGVVGTTSWGTTLAILLARQGSGVSLLARTEEEAALLRQARENARFVPGVPFPESLTVTSSADEAMDGADLAIVAVPSATFRRNVRAVASSLEPSAVVLTATKGLEMGTGKRMSQILEEELPATMHSGICALSGPNLAREINEGKISSTVVASHDGRAAKLAQAAINSPTFRVYTNNDLIGVELGGALKNIIAIGAGICDGLDVGNNAKASFLTRGLAEITRLGSAAGANPLTFAGLAGIGDLIATCSSNLSRNHTVGTLLAQGRSLPEIRESMINVAEGIDTTAAAARLASELDVSMPITAGTYDVLFNDVKLEDAIADLMSRDPAPERQGIG